MATVDKNWEENSKIKADPSVVPQTHIVNLRRNSKYTVGEPNDKYFRKGSSIFISNILAYNTNEDEKEFINFK